MADSREALRRKCSRQPCGARPPHPDGRTPHIATSAAICLRPSESNASSRTLASEFVLALHQRSVMRKAMDWQGCGHAKPSVLLGIMVMVPLLSTVVGTPFCIFTRRARAFHPTHLLLTPSWAYAARVLQDSHCVHRAIAARGPTDV